jgi:hypothetical protein
MNVCLKRFHFMLVIRFCICNQISEYKLRQTQPFIILLYTTLFDQKRIIFRRLNIKALKKRLNRKYFWEDLKNL